MKTAIELIDDERKRQIEVEGFTPEHDDEHKYGEIAQAAACYADPCPRLYEGTNGEKSYPIDWPWDKKWWKPEKTRIRQLVKAGALIVAEIERLQRLKNK